MAVYFLKVSAASAIMAAAVYFGYGFADKAAGGFSRLQSVFAVLISAGAGFAIYLALAPVFRIREAGVFIKMAGDRIRKK